MGPISWGGYCGECGPALAAEWNDQLRAKSGPAYVHWVRNTELAWRKKRIALERGAV